MKIITDYNQTCDDLGLRTAYLSVVNSRARTKRSLSRLCAFIDESVDSDNANQRRCKYARTALKQYYKIFLSNDPTNPPKIRVKSLLVLDFMVGKMIRIYNGRKYEYVKVTPEMTGSYLKEFVSTRNEDQKGLTVQKTRAKPKK